MAIMLYSWQSCEPGCVEPGCQLSVDEPSLFDQFFKAEAPELDYALGNRNATMGSSDNLELLDGGESAPESLPDLGHWPAVIAWWCSVPIVILGIGASAIWPSVIDIQARISWQHWLCLSLVAALALAMWARANRAYSRSISPPGGLEGEQLRGLLAASQVRLVELEQKLERVGLELQQRDELLQQTASEFAELEQCAHENDAELHTLRLIVGRHRE